MNILPKPFFNIYVNFLNLNDSNEREQRIKALTKDLFRLLFTLPFIVFVLTPEVTDSKAKVPSWLRLGIASFVVSPAGSMLATAALCSHASYKLFLLGADKRNSRALGFSVLAGCSGYAIAQNYECFDEGPSFEKHVINPLTNQLARFFI